MNLGFLGASMKNLGFPGLGAGGIGNQTANLFRPNQLPNLAAWFDASDSSTITIATGVSQWNDKSGNGKNLLQATGANQPTVNGGGILFNGSTHYMTAASVTIAQPITVYTVANQVAWASGAVFWSLTGNSTPNFTQTAASASPNVSASAGTPSANLTTFPVGTNGVITAIFNGASSFLRYNRTAALTGNYGAGGASSLGVGANSTPANFCNVRLFEFIIYSAAHDDATQQKIISSLGRKWSIAV